MNSEMEESKELADNRLIELQKLQQDLQNVHQENNNMKVFLCFASSYICEFSESSVLAAAQKLQISFTVEKHTVDPVRIRNSYASLSVQAQQFVKCCLFL